MKSKEILSKKEEEAVEKTLVTVEKKAEKLVPVTAKEKKNLQKPYIASEIKRISDDLGMTLSYILSLVKEQAEATKIIEEPLQEILKDENGEPIYEEKEVNGVRQKVPIMIPKKRINPDTGRVEVITVLRKVKDPKSVQWAAEFLKDALFASAPRETNLTIGINQEHITEVDRASQMLANDPELEKKIVEAIRSKREAIDADFEEIT